MADRLVGFGTCTMEVIEPTTGGSFTCMARTSGTLKVVTGTTFYTDNGADNTRYDARGKTWVREIGHVAGSPDYYPVRLGGASGGCWSGGAIWGTQSLTEPRVGSAWFGTSRAINLGTTGVLNDFLIEGLRIHNWWDGLVVSQQFDAQNCTLRGSWFSHMRDDGVENDNGREGLLVDDCLFDGVYMGFSGRGSGASNAGNTQTIRDTLARLKPMTGTDDPPDPGHGMMFKLNSGSVRYDLFDSLFAWQQGHSLGLSDNDPLADLIRYNKLRNSSGNRICWLGSGSYPGSWDVPAGFTVLTGATATTTWNNAVAAWKAAHPGVFRIPGVDS